MLYHIRCLLHKHPHLILHEEEVATGLLLLVLLGVLLVDARAEVVGVATEGDGQVLQEAVHAGHEHLGRLGRALNTGLALVHDDAVRQVGGLRVMQLHSPHHDEGVLHQERSTLGVQDVALDDLRVK